MKKNILLFFLIVTLIILGIPTLVVFGFGEKEVGNLDKPLNLTILKEKESPLVTVYRTKSKKIETYPLEEYVRGVVAGEMPANFHIEALKAQALAARTYIIRRIVANDFSDVPNGAMVDDTVKTQVFYNESELRKNWGNEYKRKISAINQAINETAGKIIVYENEPIVATFFSTSDGKTVNAEDYWQQVIPYLVSVPSPWDKTSPKYEQKITIPYNTIKEKLNVSLALPATTNNKWLQIYDKDENNRIRSVKIGEKIFTVREVRELLDLPSASFTWQQTTKGIEFNVKGYGHGVGMSQYGANGMAQEGKKAEEIVKYYYRGVNIVDYHAIAIGSKLQR